MTVTINTLGPNSRQLVIADEVGPMNIIDAVNTALVDLGWTLYDTVSSGALNCFVTKVYSAPCDDVDRGGPSTKYMILRYAVTRQLWYVSCCESWNATTHVPTNECFNNGRAVVLPFQYSNCTLYVWASARYACFMGTVSSEPSAWQGIFEFEREAAEDTATLGVPCFGWTSSLNIGTPWGNQGSASQPYTTATYTNTVFSTPRTANGDTGFAAMMRIVLKTSNGTYPPSYYQSPARAGLTSGIEGGHHGMLSGFYGLSAWALTKHVVSSLKIAGWNYFYPAGRLYGIKVGSNGLTANMLDTIDVAVDSDKFVDSSGTPTTHAILGINGGYVDSAAVASSRLSNVLYGHGVSTPNKAILVKGRYLYIAGDSFVQKMDVITGNTSALPNTGTTYDMIYDGGNYLYLASGGNGGLQKFDINTDLQVGNNLTSSTGYYRSIAMDDTYIYASWDALSNQPKIDIINLSSFTVERTYTQSVLANNLRFTMLDTLDCNTGAVFACFANATSSTPADHRLVKVTGTTGGVVSLTLSNTYALNSSVNGGMIWDGSNITVITATAAPSVRMISVNPTSMTAVVTGSQNSALAPCGTRSARTNNMVPYKGYYCWPSAGTTNLIAAYANNLNLSGWTQASLADAGQGQMSVTTSSFSPFSIATDGCTLFCINASNVCKVGNGYGMNVNNGNPGARILLPL